MLGYMGKICRVDLTEKKISYEFPEEAVMRKFIGGTGLGVYYLYNEVPPGVEWSDPENRFIMLSGPVGGAPGPTGTYTVVCKGPMTNGPAEAQANGQLGAFLRRCGLDGVIVQGASGEPVYLLISNNNVEIRDARHLMGMDTWETSEAIEQELGKDESKLAVMAIGPAGENKVRFAATCAERGHVAAHNGPGAVLGSKNLKAVAVERGTQTANYADRDKISRIIQEVIKTKTKKSTNYAVTGTSNEIIFMDNAGLLPIKNYTISDGSDYHGLQLSNYIDRFERERTLCWGCSFKHCYRITVKDGPFKGYEGEEQEYENMAAMGSLIGVTDAVAAQVLGNTVDKLGMDVNECGWLIGWLMECYEKGYITSEELDGIELTWGNVEGVLDLLNKIAYREGVGNQLAEGVMRVATAKGGEAQDAAIYTKKGNTPRGHDHRAKFNHILDTAMSSMGTDEMGTMGVSPVALGLPEGTDRNTPEGAAKLNAASARNGVKQLLDSLTICYSGTAGINMVEVTDIIAAATGWDYSLEDAIASNESIHVLMRCFGIRHGHTKEMDEPSKRYASAVLKGPETGKTMYPVWNEARDIYYREMDWDVETGKPLPETLKRLGLEYVIHDIWE